MGRLQDEMEGESDNTSVAAESESSADSTELARVLCAVARTMERLVSRNENCLEIASATGGSRRTTTLYHASRLPSISIAKYLQRIKRYTRCSPCCFVVAFIYMDRLLHKLPHFPLILLNIHRLLLTSIMVATKFLDDSHYDNAFYAQVGGISVHELNYLEIDFLFKLNFHLQVTPFTYEGYCTHLERELLSSSEGVRIERTLPSCLSHRQDKKPNAIQDAHMKLTHLTKSDGFWKSHIHQASG